MGSVRLEICGDVTVSALTPDLTNSSDGILRPASGSGPSPICLHGHPVALVYVLACRVIRLVVFGLGNGLELCEISHRIDSGSNRARHRVELVTDDAKALCEQLESATGERVSTLEVAGVAAEKPIAEEKARGRKDRGTFHVEAGWRRDRHRQSGPRDEGDDAQPEKVPEQEKSRGPRGIEMEIFPVVSQTRAAPEGLLTSTTNTSIQSRRASGRRSISIRRRSWGDRGRSRPSGCLGSCLS